MVTTDACPRSLLLVVDPDIGKTVRPPNSTPRISKDAEVNIFLLTEFNSPVKTVIKFFYNSLLPSLLSAYRSWKSRAAMSSPLLTEDFGRLPDDLLKVLLDLQSDPYPHV